MSNEWDDMAGQWEEYPLVTVYAQKAYANLTEAVDLKALRILDFGCGTGLLSELMLPEAREIVALDASAGMIDMLAKKDLENVEVIAAELSLELIRSYEALSEKFDLIVASSVCSFLPDYPETLRLLTSMLTDEGVFVQWDWLAEQEDAPNALSRGQIKEAFEKANLHIKTLSVPFSMSFDDSEMPVIMAVGSPAD
ncbi:class I SAM-dependent DNA methyltransferase [Robertkochia sediminum]|uniref:class I SAM-dependent DNA methyltransferase n=1 Tax=Robertkochia sediminum TaxID=2785326 RepID=UPI001931DA47|nr:class I SAM-dependent methyltransferase [Robertkochia sediminum]MBL7472923.1 class I SAM-dependent methyltransferase [Robertkochia sediminum]